MRYAGSTGPIIRIMRMRTANCWDGPLNVLYVPKLSYNLLSVSRTSDAGKIARFGETSCQILDANRKLVAVTTRVGDLYHLSCRPGSQNCHTAVDKGAETKRTCGIDDMATLEQGTCRSWPSTNW